MDATTYQELNTYQRAALASSPFVGAVPDRLAYALMTISRVTGELARHALLQDAYPMDVDKALAWLVYVGDMTEATQASMYHPDGANRSPEYLQAEFDAWVRLYNLAQGQWPNAQIRRYPVDVIGQANQLLIAMAMLADAVGLPLATVGAYQPAD